MKQLTDLRLHNNNLSGEIPEFFGDMKQIRILDLHNNSFTGEFPVTSQSVDMMIPC